MTYGTNQVDRFRTLASMLRILKGDKQSDLPIQQPTKFRFVINANAARALGLKIPAISLALADECVESTA